MAFPSTPASGKDAKVSISTTDGTQLSSQVMTKQASYTYKGETYTDRVYLLGAGQTLINMRPAKEPRFDIDGIIDGIECSPTTSNDEVQTSAGSILVDNVETSVAADASIAVTRPAAGEGAWVAIHVNKSTGALSATKGTDTTAGTGKAALLDTYGTAAGERPYIPTTDLLVALIQLDNGAAVVEVSEIFSYDREVSDIDPQPLPNVGGTILPSALVALHTGGVAREVKFTGYVLDDALQLVGTAKTWSLTANANEISDTTFFRPISISEISGWGFTFEQLATDPKVKNILLSRQGYVAVKLEYPNGGYWQGVGTMTATFNVATGALNNITITGTLLDDPIFN